MPNVKESSEINQTKISEIAIDKIHFSIYTHLCLLWSDPETGGKHIYRIDA